MSIFWMLDMSYSPKIIYFVISIWKQCILFIFYISVIQCRICYHCSSPLFIISELSLMSSRIEQKNKGDKIEGVLRKEFPRLADEIDPEAVARYLYGLSIIDRSELELAMVKSTKQTDRSSRLLLHLIRKLKANPNWCDDAIVALRKAGVNTESITVALEDAGISK